MKLVYVAMSGGVDSSVAAALLKKRGFDVVGVFMKPWQPKIGSFCMWKEDREDAMRAASVLGIPFETWDFSEQYKKSVTDYMVREYKAGRTPNPDVMCNKEIKFGLFFDRAIKKGADFIATGHYIKIRKEWLAKRALRKEAGMVSRRDERLTKAMRTLAGRSNGSLGNYSFRLLVARDKNKDQSYFLWTLKQKHLEKCLFPVGDYTKPEVRKLAKKFSLPNYDKKDSQGVCFIGPLDMKGFLKTRIKSRKGKILNLTGKILGEHDGVYYYTIGQRHGLNLSIGGGPYYVVSKNIKKNIIYVGEEKDLYSKKLKVSEISWINEEPKLPTQLDVRLRYRAGLKKAILKKNGKLELKTPERAITSGQSAVFYRKGELLGGGTIL